MLGGGPVACRSKKRTVVVHSTLESEYVAISFAVREAIWLKKLRTELRGQKLCRVTLFGENQGMIAISLDGCYNERSKKIDVEYHLVQNAVRRGIVKVGYVSTKDMIADVLNKAIDRVAHNCAVHALNLVEV